MLAGVALGLVVDDTTHFLYRFRCERAASIGVHEAVSRSMNDCGRAVVFTSVVLAMGFSVLALASFNPVIHFGILSSIVIVLALLFDLIVLPALLGLFPCSGRASSM